MATVLITGANRGLGLEFARQYVADGWDVVACCRAPEEARELAELAAAGPAQVERLDVRDHRAIDALGEKFLGRPIDVLLNNAGVIGPLPIADNVARQHFGTMDYGLWSNVMETNAFAPVKLAETFVANVAASAQKKIVNISSTVGSIGELSVPSIAYASSKSALNRAMTIIANGLRDRGIIVALFCPGYVKTRMDAFGYATVEIPDSVSALRGLIAGLTLDDSGHFTRFDGTPIAW
jgi:NAD(P)-dependent dehydrogenase (short-subunit alcohol dehydrogenase family)